MASTVAAWAASTAGWRYVLPQTSGPRRTLSVTAPIPARIAQVSGGVSPLTPSSGMK